MLKAKIFYIFALLSFIYLFLLPNSLRADFELVIPPSHQMSGLTFLTPFDPLPNQDDLSPSILNGLLMETPTPLFLNDKPAVSSLPKVILKPPLESTTSATPKLTFQLSANIHTPYSISPLAIPIVTPTPTPIQTPSPSPLPSSTPAAEKQVSLALSNGGLDADKIFNLVNTYRQKLGLASFQKDDRVCRVAVSRAPELVNEFATGNLHHGIRTRNLPYWNSENVISVNSEQQALSWWLSDYIHRKSIEGDYKYSCVACSGINCVQEFTSFQFK